MEITVPQAVRALVAAADSANLDHVEIARIEALPQSSKIVTKDGLKFVRTSRIHDGFCNRDTGELCSARDILVKHGGLRQQDTAECDLTGGLPPIPAGPNYNARVLYVLEQCYHLLATDADLETVSASATYASLTNMVAAVLDEAGSSQISLSRRFAYRYEAAMKGWSGLITPAPVAIPATN